MIIARIGDFALGYKIFLGDHIYTTYDLEIVKYQKSDKSYYSNPDSAPDESCFVIATFDVAKDPYESDVVSCGTRLIDAIYDSNDPYEASKALKQLIDIGMQIMCTDKYENDYHPNKECKAWRYNQETGLLDEIKNEDDENV